MKAVAQSRNLKIAHEGLVTNISVSPQNYSAGITFYFTEL